MSGSMGLQGEALSADPSVNPAVQMRSVGRSSRNPTYSSSTQSRGYSRSGTAFPQNPTAVALPQNPGPAYCPPQGCPPSSGTQGWGSPFTPGGMALSFPWWTPLLPRPGCKQFELSARIWYSRLNASTIVWGTNLIGGEGTELDLHNDLGLTTYNWIPEYEGRFQLKQNWGIRFSFMPISLRENSTPQFGFFFGNSFYPAFVPIVTTWDRKIYRWDIVYNWFQQRHAVSSIFAGYSLYDDKLVVSNILQYRTRSNTFGLAYAGMSIDRVIRCLGAGTASIHCRASAQFLEGYFGWDGYATGRMSVPMDCGRYGYIEAGWRWIVLERNTPSYRDKTSIDGAIGAVGLVF